MYEVVFKDVGFHLLFLDFQMSVFRCTKLSPGQIHPNSYAFMRAFELVCEYLEVVPSKNVFFALFNVQRGVERGGGYKSVSFRQKEKMFNIFAGNVRSFMERFFLVRPKSEEALNNLLRPAEAARANDGEAPVRVSLFPLEWSGDHYKFKPNDYGRSLSQRCPVYGQFDCKVSLWFSLPNVWSEPDRYWPSTTLGLSDPEWKVIQNLETAGQSRAMTEGIIVAMKALEIAVVVNNASTEGEVMAKVLRKERDTLLAKIAKMEETAIKAKKEFDRRIGELEERVVEAQKALALETEAKVKLAEENKSLEDFRKAIMPKEDESDDIAVLDKAGLLEKIEVFESNLVVGVKHGLRMPLPN